jgi:hypothetical protein
VAEIETLQKAQSGNVRNFREVVVAEVEDLEVGQLREDWTDGLHACAGRVADR